jgi:tRNA (guanine-N7-)-methyltransferase
VRQKRVREATPETMTLMGVLHDMTPASLPDKPIHLEIGSGKGKFITELAAANPDIHYIALEQNINVCYRIAQKKESMGLGNLTVILDKAENIVHYLGTRKAERLFLMFSDPWPKARHHKRRLTHPRYLSYYMSFLSESATIVFRTDHADFFEDSLLYFHGLMTIEEVSYDLPEGPHMTEYEEKKRDTGPIHQLIAKVNTHAQTDL